MKLLISLVLGVCLLLAILHEYCQPQPSVEGERIAVFQGDVPDSVIVNSLSWADTLEVYQENDILHFIPISGGDEYKVMSEEAKYNIGIFSRSDAKSFLYWALMLPLPQGDGYAQQHYQEIVEEKLWEK